MHNCIILNKLNFRYRSVCRLFAWSQLLAKIHVLWKYNDNDSLHNRKSRCKSRVNAPRMLFQRKVGFISARVTARRNNLELTRVSQSKTAAPEQTKRNFVFPTIPRGSGWLAKPTPALACWCWKSRRELRPCRVRKIRELSGGGRSVAGRNAERRGRRNGGVVNASQSGLRINNNIITRA